MLTNPSLVRDSSLVFSPEAESPGPGWLSRCLGQPFPVFGFGEARDLMCDLLRRRILWLAAQSLEIDEQEAERRFLVEEDENGCLVLLLR
jgi:hypothetical protein